MKCHQYKDLPDFDSCGKLPAAESLLFCDGPHALPVTLTSGFGVEPTNHQVMEAFAHNRNSRLTDEQIEQLQKKHGK